MSDPSGAATTEANDTPMVELTPVTSVAATATVPAPPPATPTANAGGAGNVSSAPPVTTAKAAAAAAAGGAPGEEFVVERILQLRVRQGKKEYLIKWKGFGPEENSWEPEENCDCPAIVEAFERERRQQPGGKSSSTGDSGGSGKKKAEAAKKRAALQQVIDFNDAGQPRGFDRGLQPERILGATDSLGELMFLMKWRDCDEADLVPARQANVKCPQVVISFYEERLSWYNDDEEAAA